jgi:ABC-type bacteriocin/lantibiotic exporter with double-glycine peptidase domain
VSNALLLDFIIAAAVAIVLVIVSPGLAVVGLVAIVVLVVCGLTFALDRRRTRRGGRSRRRAPHRPAARPARRR